MTAPNPVNRRLMLLSIRTEVRAPALSQIRQPLTQIRATNMRRRARVDTSLLTAQMLDELPRIGRQFLAAPHADRQIAHRPGIGQRDDLIAMVFDTRRAVVSGTMPMPTLHSTSRQTASKLRNCTRSRNGRPMRTALVARKRWMALARSSPTKS